METAPIGKLKQMMAYGADIFRVKGFGLDPNITARAFQTLQQIGISSLDYALQVSAYTYSPAGMTGVETISFELADQLDSIDHVFCPAGGGGLCVSTVARDSIDWSMKENRRLVRQCTVFSRKGTTPLPDRCVTENVVHKRLRCTSKISGLQVANVIDGDLVIARMPSDRRHRTYRRRRNRHGPRKRDLRAKKVSLPNRLVPLLWPESSKQSKAGELDRNATIVCLVTGIGFKDEASIERMIADSECPILTGRSTSSHLTSEGESNSGIKNDEHFCKQPRRRWRSDSERPCNAQTTKMPENDKTILDYGLSFICNEASFNNVQFWIESRTTIIDQQNETSANIISVDRAKAKTLLPTRIYSSKTTTIFCRFWVGQHG